MLSISLKTLGDISDLENIGHRISYISAVIAHCWQISCVICPYIIGYNYFCAVYLLNLKCLLRFLGKYSKDFNARKFVHYLWILSKLYFSFWIPLGNIYSFLRRFETTLSTNVGRNLRVYIAISRRYISSLSDVKFSFQLFKAWVF